MSALKLLTGVGATKLKTFILPFMPTQSSQVWPSIVTLVCSDPMGCTPPIRASLDRLLPPCKVVTSKHLPDHELVLAAGGLMVGVCSSEKIVRNISTDVVTAVLPFSGGLHVGDGADGLLIVSN